MADSFHGQPLGWDGHRPARHQNKDIGMFPVLRSHAREIRGAVQAQEGGDIIIRKGIEHQR